MKKTNANDFRENLKSWFDTAMTEPVKITRKSGDSFYLVQDEIFEKMRLDLAELNGVMMGLNDVIQGRTSSNAKVGVKKTIEKSKERFAKLNAKKDPY